MIRSKFFWRMMMSGSVVLYAVSLWLVFFTAYRAMGIILLVSLLLLHTAELKTALRIGKEHGLTPKRIVLLNLIFGFTWWLPLKNDILGGA